MAARPQIILPADASDAEMREILMKVLPDIVRKSPETTPLHHQAVPELVDAIVFAARECGDSPALHDMAYQMLTTRPTPEQCQKLVDGIRELVDIRFAGLKGVPMARRSHAFKTWLGKLWFDVVTTFGGDPSIDRTRGPSAGAIRG